MKEMTRATHSSVQHDEYIFQQEEGAYTLSARTEAFLPETSPPQSVAVENMPTRIPVVDPERQAPSTAPGGGRKPEQSVCDDDVGARTARSDCPRSSACSSTVRSTLLEYQYGIG